VPSLSLLNKGDVPNLLDILRPALDFVLPERCPCCGVITPPGGSFCADCWRRLHFLTPPWCAGCAMPLNFGSLGFAADDEQFCASCLAAPPQHDGIRAAVAYSKISRQVVLRLKYGGKIGMAKLVAAHLSRHLPEASGEYLIVPVPLHWTRLWNRGFNQSALIAKALVAKTELGKAGMGKAGMGKGGMGEKSLIFAPDLLIRNKRTPPLKDYSGKQRKKLVSGAFAVNPKWQSRLNGAHILLIDDVLTSGATANACVKTLKKSGAQWVQIFCWARVLRGEAAERAEDFVYDA
jgi:predicted amidophosphoribosyltransferase